MSTKDFKAGMVAGAKPFGDKLDQLANVSEKAVGNINEGIDGINTVVNCILDDLSVQEKKNIYDLDTPQGITDLDETEKEYIMSVLFTIADAKGSTTDYQRFYLRSLKSYLGIVNIQNGLDLSTIENIESVAVQKVLMQTVMEFLYLEYQNHDYMDDYEELFDYFSVNKRGIKELMGSIDHMANLLGVEGVACHYSPLAEPEPVEEEFIDEIMAPNEPEENGFNTDILEDVLIEGDTSGRKVAVGIKAFTVIEEDRKYERKCVTITGRIQPYGKWEFKDCVIKAEDATFVSPENIVFENCEIHVGPEFLNLSDKAYIDNCTFIGNDRIGKNDVVITLCKGTAKNSKFENISGQIKINRIYDCSFENCRSVEGYDILSDESPEIRGCAFINCDSINVESALLENCNLKNCKSIYIGEKAIRNCVFEDCIVTDYEGALITDTMDSDAVVSDCTFNNISMTEGSYLFDVFGSCSIRNCIYNNCITDRRDREMIHYGD